MSTTLDTSTNTASPICDRCLRSSIDDVVLKTSSLESPLGFQVATSSPSPRWNSQCLCLFTRLPDKYLVEGIFPYLDIASLVSSSQTCSRWRALTEEASLYKNLHVDSLKTEAEAKAFKIISRRRLGDLVETLKVRVGVEINKEASRLSASTFSARLSRLSALSFIGAKSKTNAADVTSFVTAHPTLRRLILDGITTLRDENVREMLGGLEGGGGLRQLSVNQCRGLTNDFLNCLSNSESANTLEILSFEGCVFSSSSLTSFLLSGGGKNLKRLYARGLRGADDALCNVLSKCCPRLEELDVSNENPFGTISDSSITDKGLNILASTLGSKLRTLRIQGHVQITDAGLADALFKLPCLEVLDTRGCRQVSDQSASALAASHDRKGLREVRFFGSSISDAGLASLSSVLCRNSSSLEIVDLFGCKNLTFSAVKIFIEALSLSRSNQVSRAVTQHTTVCLGGIRCLQIPSVKVDLLSISSNLKILFV